MIMELSGKNKMAFCNICDCFATYVICSGGDPPQNVLPPVRTLVWRGVNPPPQWMYNFFSVSIEGVGATSSTDSGISTDSGNDFQDPTVRAISDDASSVM